MPLAFQISSFYFPPRPSAGWREMEAAGLGGAGAAGGGGQGGGAGGGGGTELPELPGLGPPPAVCRPP